MVFHSMAEEGAFLHMLRPYRGLKDEVLADLRAALVACRSTFSRRELPRELVSAVWSIAQLGRLWAIEPKGMIQRNRLMTPADTAKITTFMDRFESTMLRLLADGTADPFDEWPA